MRWAITARGLSLDRLCDRLAALGLRVSVSTLSNWQRGVSRPQRPESLRAVAELELLLGLAAGSLSRLLAEPAHRGGRRRPALVPGTPLLPATRLRAALADPAEPDLDVLAVQDDVTVSDRGWVSTVRSVVRARRSGAGRHVLLYHVGAEALPEIRAGRDCALGRVRTDPDAGLIAAELLFGPLARGETFALEHTVTSTEADLHHGRWFRTAGQHFELTVRFGPTAGARRAYRIWRLDSRSPHKDVSQLRLIDGRLAHLVDYDLSPGFHGIRWTG
ncbi:transcriptional regulator with XRE-family HTH domain [Kitasatospora gansuensis]|uniref:Transcriptional regulator with XRE-family HTH domain n=1 Tax=Kitasatospora gansuensis TaxID=258050 RepID=A0A7W7SJ41_9ACTN|nr:hypothetical protein [Kitasatospora gansuensis]MBB4951395.1 transcriptional regulator with XRE-family HTH domain [Kitasatospora gansuensis]